MADTRRVYRWKADDLARKASDAAKVLSTFTEPVIADLIRRGEETNEPDGYPAGAGDGSGVRGSDQTTSTERAALYGLPDKPYDEYGVKLRDDWGNRQHERDAIGECLEDIFTRLVELSGHATIIERKRLVVIKAGDKLRGRQIELVQCQGCHRDVACTTADPIRAGYCSACSTRWYEWWNERKALVGANKPLEMQRFEEQRARFEGHNENACQLCADPIYKRAKAS